MESGCHYPDLGPQAWDDADIRARALAEQPGWCKDQLSQLMFSNKWNVSLPFSGFAYVPPFNHPDIW